MNVYDTRFDSNEWFVLAGLFIGAALVVILPKRFRAKNAIVYYTCGLYSGLFFDHSLGLEPVDFYDVNDSSHYEWTDFLSYVSFGCVSYIFFYVYDRIGVRPSGIAVYVLVCALLSTGMEWFAVKAHVFHYRHGYRLAYSVLIYLIVHSCWLALFHWCEKIAGGRPRRQPG